ncbi:7436_t:CDS:2 [Funneliformis caledonium]|uniref:7436_t:CDS:1 n=1 Tax=Funneliformis caledonium TaxID=1117310 RepID=A0A9N8YZH3_9GLOM|nr:7436_t:CDS:2 [Funneliformis caledonium]
MFRNSQPNYHNPHKCTAADYEWIILQHFDSKMYSDNVTNHSSRKHIL